METIEDIKQYFIEISEMTKTEKWLEGAEVADLFMDFKKQAKHTEEDFNSIMEKVESCQSPGSVWFYMWQLIRNWGFEKGYTVPENHPWYIDTTRITCINTDAFEHALTEEREYKILDQESKEGFIRVKDDNGKHSWFPTKCFEEPRKIIRTYTKKST